MNNKTERRFETILVERDKPPNLRLTVDLLIQKINRGELNKIENAKREIRRTSSGNSKPDGHEEH